MGRPIKPVKIGNTGDAGEQIVVKGIAVQSEGIEDLFIVKQLNDSRFRCVDVATGNITKDIQLQEATPTVEGEGRIEVFVFGGGTEHAKAIQQHLVKTFEGNIFKYDVDIAAATNGEADIDTA